jgi:hypothetical protein
MRFSPKTPARERIERCVVIDDRGCWNWMRQRNRLGYGLMRWRGRKVPVHRVSYEAFVGPIPEGLEIDHLCRNRACCNPEHLEAVTRRTNVLRSGNFIAARASADHCINGHPFAGENLRTDKDGERVCKACNRAAAERYRQRQRGNRP